jgi:hypothetical protein
MKVLALGFSVTAQYPGYVGIISSAWKDDADLDIIGVGLGGLQHYHTRYLFPAIINEHKPDVIIIDHATPAFRNWASDIVGQQDYKKSMMSLLRVCCEHKVRVLLIDFPRADVDYNNDWVTIYHKEISDALSIPYKLLQLKDKILRDEVHTTKLGDIYYAEEVVQLIGQAALVTKLDLYADLLSDLPRYDSVLASEICVDKNEKVFFSRSGYSEYFIKINEGETIALDFGKKMLISGYSNLIGPLSGFMEMNINGKINRHLNYDQHCYYNRIKATILSESVISSQLAIKQVPEIPDIKLLKGDKNFQKRIGAIGRILIQDQTVNNSRLIESCNLSLFPISSSEVVDNVFCKYQLFDTNKPLLFVFSNEASILSKEQVNNSTYSTWEFDFLIKQEANVISFSCIENITWYRSLVFTEFMLSLGKAVKKFPEKLGYGSSMGGYGASAFSDVLHLERVLLLNPISTLNPALVPWETRFMSFLNLNWNDDFNDGAATNCKGYVVYDPIHDLDKKHVQRYSHLTHLKIFGVGHGMPIHLLKMGILNRLLTDFIKNNIDTTWFFKKSRKRKMYKGYYEWLLSRENKRLTPSRIKVIKRHYRSLLGWLNENEPTK